MDRPGMKGLPTAVVSEPRGSADALCVKIVSSLVPSAVLRTLERPRGLISSDAIIVNDLQTLNLTALPLG